MVEALFVDPPFKKGLKMAEIKLGRNLELAHSGHTWEQTVAAIFVQPLVNFFIRTAEIMLLAGAFEAAANATGSVTLKALAGIMYFALSAHLFHALWRYVVFPLNRTIRIRATLLNLIPVLIGGGAFVLLCWFLVQQIVEASKTIVLAC